MTTGPWRVDHTSEALAAFLAAHPVSLTDWERRTQERAFEVPDWMQVRADIQRSGEDY